MFLGHFPPTSPIIGGSFAENDLQLKASYGTSPPCSVLQCVVVYCSVLQCTEGHDKTLDYFGSRTNGTRYLMLNIIKAQP